MLPRCGASSFRLGGCFSCQGTLLGRMPAVVPLLRLNHHHHSSARALSRASKSWHSSSPLVRACCPQTRLLPEPCGSRTPELQRRFLIERFIGAGSGKSERDRRQRGKGTEGQEGKGKRSTSTANCCSCLLFLPSHRLIFLLVGKAIRFLPLWL